jgi:hypothetical protein
MMLSNSNVDSGSQRSIAGWRRCGKRKKGRDALPRYQGKAYKEKNCHREPFARLRINSAKQSLPKRRLLRRLRLLAMTWNVK